MEPLSSNTTTALPEWVTATGSFIIFIVTAGFAAYGWIKTKFPTMVATKPAGGDAVVLSAAIADSAAINKLAAAINALIERQELQGDLDKLQVEIVVGHLRVITGELKKINERAEYGSRANIPS